MQASVILDRASKTLFDETQVRWTDLELLDYLNSGISALATFKPDTATVNSDVSPSYSTAKQQLPAGGIQFLDCKYYKAIDGTITVVRQIDKNHLDHSDPDWYSSVGPTVKHYVHDPREPSVYYLYPHPADGQIQLSYIGTPTRLTSATEIIPVPDTYETFLYYWVVGYCLAKQFKAGDLNKTNAYMTMANNMIGAKNQAQGAFAPLDPDSAEGRKE